jgi:protoheme IX farnesyltransferase
VNKQRVHSISSNRITNWWSDVAILTKSRLTALVVLTSVLAYLVSVGMSFDWGVLMLLISGGYMVAGAANALNQVIEKDFDAQMTRTKDRPVAAGRMTTSQGVVTAGVFLLVGTALLSLIHPLTALLGMISVVSYAFLYTPMKRYTTLAVPIGAIPGAMPVLIGCVAGEGSLTTLAVMLFAIQFLWQFPHFWSIAYLSHDDYRDAGYKFLHSEADGTPDRLLGWYSFIYSVFLIGLAVAAWSIGYTGVLGGLILTGLSAYYAWKSYVFYRDFNRESARALMFASFGFIPVALICFMLNGVV